MKAVLMRAHGRPDQVCETVELDDIESAGDGEVVVEIEASAINPADLLILEGNYPGPDELPAPIGIEGAGRVVAVGSGIADLAPGDKVLSMGRSNWAQRVLLKAEQSIKIPAALDSRQAAMLKANPPTAHLML